MMRLFVKTLQRVDNFLPEWLRKLIRRWAVRVDDRLPEWARQMIRRPEWQESSLVSGTIWVVVTLVVYNVVAQFGHGWKVNVAVSLAADMVLYLLARFKIWEKRRSGITRSAAFWFGWWAFFVIFNAGLAWLIMGRADVGTFLSRVILGLYGGLMNPVVFKFRDKFIFPPKTAIP